MLPYIFLHEYRIFGPRSWSELEEIIPNAEKKFELAYDYAMSEYKTYIELSKEYDICLGSISEFINSDDFQVYCSELYSKCQSVKSWHMANGGRPVKLIYEAKKKGLRIL